MAIAFDNSTGQSITNPGSTHTFSHTCSGSDRILFVLAWHSTGDYITGVTYAGTPMTQLKKVSSNGTNWIYMYYLVAPATGANNVVITSSVSNGAILGMSASYTGVDQSSPIDVSTSETTASSTSVTTSLTTTTDNCWTIAMYRENAGRAMTGDANTTIRSDTDPGKGVHIGDSNGDITPAGATSLGGSISFSTSWGELMAAFKPKTTTATDNAIFFGSNF